ncbi:MAG: DUF192 domain-containing protein [Longimicrobiales bacterium]|nr:DUF192 domain-containing protein [Longimicrobiales bacterium]
MRNQARSCAVASALVLWVAAPACHRAEPWVSPVAFDTARSWLIQAGDSVPLLLEVAKTDAQRTVGLMDRPFLEESSGMVFLFDTVRSEEAGFWMWRTKMPLDIAFMDSAGVIMRIVEMEPCETRYHPTACPQYRPGVEYWSALEVNRGWLASQRLGVGARLEMEEGVP